MLTHKSLSSAKPIQYNVCYTAVSRVKFMAQPAVDHITVRYVSQLLGLCTQAISCLKFILRSM